MSNKSELTEYRDVLVAIRDNVAKLKQQGRSLEDTIAAKPTAAFDAKWGHFVITPGFFTRLVYRGVCRPCRLLTRAVRDRAASRNAHRIGVLKGDRNDPGHDRPARKALGRAEAQSVVSVSAHALEFARSSSL